MSAPLIFRTRVSNVRVSFVDHSFRSETCVASFAFGASEPLSSSPRRVGVAAEVTWNSPLGDNGGNGVYEAASAGALERDVFAVTLSADGALLGSASVPLSVIASCAPAFSFEIRDNGGTGALVAALRVTVVFEEDAKAASATVSVRAVHGIQGATSVLVMIDKGTPSAGSVISSLPGVAEKIALAGTAAEILPATVTLVINDASGGALAGATFRLHLYGGRGEAVPFSTKISGPDGTLLGDVEGALTLSSLPRFAQMVGGVTTVNPSKKGGSAITETALLCAFLLERPRFHWRPMLGRPHVIYERDLTVRAPNEGEEGVDNTPSLEPAPSAPDYAPDPSEVVNEPTPPPPPPQASTAQPPEPAAPAFDPAAALGSMSLEAGNPVPAPPRPPPSGKPARPSGPPPPRTEAAAADSAANAALAPPPPPASSKPPARPAAPPATVELPWFWQMNKDSNGRPFFLNHVAQSTAWTLPIGSMTRFGGAVISVTINQPGPLGMVIDDAYTARARLGLSGELLPQPPSPGGAGIASVAVNSQAAAAGIMPGMGILTINGADVSAVPFQRVIEMVSSSGRPLTLTLFSPYAVTPEMAAAASSADAIVSSAQRPPPVAASSVPHPPPQAYPQQQYPPQQQAPYGSPQSAPIGTQAYVYGGAPQGVYASQPAYGSPQQQVHYAMPAQNPYGGYPGGSAQPQMVYAAPMPGYGMMPMNAPGMPYNAGPPMPGQMPGGSYAPGPTPSAYPPSGFMPNNEHGRQQTPGQPGGQPAQAYPQSGFMPNNVHGRQM